MPKNKPKPPEVPNGKNNSDAIPRTGSTTPDHAGGATKPTKLAESPQPDNRGGDSPDRGTAPVVGAGDVKPLTETPTTERPKRIRRTGVQIAADKAAAENAAREANKENLERLRTNTSATVGVFIDGFDPLFQHIIPPPLAEKEKTALTHVWTGYLIQDGVEIPMLKAAVVLSLIVIVPRTILAIVDYVQKRRERAKLAA